MKPIEQLTKQERLEVYKKALEFYENQGTESHKIYDLTCYSGLCLVLPCIYWQIGYMQMRPDTDRLWRYQLTPEWFPEIAESIESISSNVKLTDKKRLKERISALKEIINASTTRQ